MTDFGKMSSIIDIRQPWQGHTGLEVEEYIKSVFQKFLSSNTGGGVIYAEKLDDSNFENALNLAIALSSTSDLGYTTIDCTYFTGEQTFYDAIHINHPVKIILGNVNITSYGNNVFSIESNNVQIIGANRETDRTDRTKNATIITCTYISNLPNEGYHIYSRGCKNCQYHNLTLIGTRTTLGRQCNNASYPINGCGGIYIEKADPGTVYGGNTVNATIIENILIDGTKAHGIYIDTPILSYIQRVRLSQVAGHGIFISGGTSTTLESVYVASCQLAGFCIYGVTYCTILNSVAEYCGLGWWIRSSFNVSIFSPGIEHTINYGKNPWNRAYSVTNRYGFNLTTTNLRGETVRINDVPDENYTLRNETFRSRDMYIGNGFIFSGGRNIDVYSPYATGLAFAENEAETTTAPAELRYCCVLGNNRATKISNIGFSSGGTTHAENIPYEMEIMSTVNGLEVTFNPNNTTLRSYTSPLPVTSNTALTAPILNLCANALIRFGNVYYTPVEFAGNLALQGNFNVGENLNVRGQIYTQTGILYRGYLEREDIAELLIQTVYSPSTDEIPWSDSGVNLVISLEAVYGDTDVTNLVSWDLYVNNILYETYTGVSEIIYRLLTAGEYSFYLVATYTVEGVQKQTTSEYKNLTYKEKEVIQPTFNGVEETVFADKSVTITFLVLSSFEITSAGLAYSSTNTSPTINQNKADALSIDVDQSNPLLYRVVAVLPRTSPSQTRYVRMYFATSDTQAQTTSLIYSDTYLAINNTFELYEA